MILGVFFLLIKYANDDAIYEQPLYAVFGRVGSCTIFDPPRAHDCAYLCIYRYVEHMCSWCSCGGGVIKKFMTGVINFGPTGGLPIGKNILKIRGFGAQNFFQLLVYSRQRGLLYKGGVKNFL